MNEALIVTGWVALTVAGFCLTLAAGFAVVGTGFLLVGLARWWRTQQ